MDDAAIDRPDVVAEVCAAFEQYELDLVANDVEQLVDWFWDDDRAVRYGIDESHVGHDAIATFRRGQSVATPPRDLRNTIITAFGPDLATANTEFLPHGSDAIGRQSQTWARIDGRWRIVSAHVSWLSGQRP
jgi:Protein of unknown function (DUF3225)